jgi:hypothetical protein
MFHSCDRVLLCSQVNLELTILPHQPPKYWDHRHAPSHPAEKAFYVTFRPQGNIAIFEARE